MLLDAALLYSDDQAVTTTAASTNSIDLDVINRGQGNPLSNFVNVTEAFAGGTSITFAIQDSADDATFATIATTGAIALADLVEGAVIDNLPTIPPTSKRYVRMNYTVAGTMTAGKISSGIKLGTQKDDDLAVVPAGN